MKRLSRLSDPRSEQMTKSGTKSSECVSGNAGTRCFVLRGSSSQVSIQGKLDVVAGKIGNSDVNQSLSVTALVWCVFEVGFRHHNILPLSTSSLLGISTISSHSVAL